MKSSMSDPLWSRSPSAWSQAVRRVSLFMVVSWFVCEGVRERSVPQALAQTFDQQGEGLAAVAHHGDVTDFESRGDVGLAEAVEQHEDDLPWRFGQFVDAGAEGVLPFPLDQRFEG